MTKNEFFKTVEQIISEQIPEIELIECRKNNGIVKTGLTLNQGNGAVPVLYLDDFYNAFQKNGDFGAVICRIANIYTEMIKDNISGRNVANVLKENLPGVTPRVINAERNKSLLEECPHRRLFDLAAVYQINFDTDKSCVIKNDALEFLGVNEEWLYEKAVENAERNVKTLTVLDIAKRSFGASFSADVEEDFFKDNMLFLTNPREVYGASAMVCTEALSAAADRLGDDLYILPSSVHELVVVPATGNSPSELEEMVAMVNATDVAPEEYLSGNIYYFNSISRKLSIVK